MLKLLPIVILAVALTSCAWRGEATLKRAAVGELQIVPVAIAARANLSSSLALTGEFLPYQEVDLMAKVAGYIRTISVDIGDRVYANELLATLEIPEMGNDLAKAEAAVEQTEAELGVARDELQRARSANDIAHLSFVRIEDVAKSEPGLVPRQEVDEAQSKDLMTEAQAAGAKSNLSVAALRTKVARAEELRIRTMNAYARITAPFEGVVTKRYASVGSMIQAGIASQSQAMPVLRISQNNLLRLIVPVPESAVARIHKGESVVVRVSALGQTFPGQVVRFADKLQQDTRTMDTEVDIANPDLKLVPGMYAEVTLQLSERNQVISVPLDGVETSNGVSQVFLVQADGVIRRSTVVTGVETAQRIEIRSGVNAGDMVVVGRHAGLRDGQHVHTKLSEVS